MILRAALIERGLGPKKLVREIKAINIAAWRQLGEVFHAEYLPRRFTYGGGKALGFTPRKPGYNARKVKTKGHVDFLKFSGEAERLTTKIKDIRVSGIGPSSHFLTTCRVVIHARKLNWRNKHSIIRMNDEIRTIGQREVGPLTRVLDQAIQAELKKRDQSK